MPAPTANLPIVGNIVTAEGRNAVLNDALQQLWQALLANATEEQIAEVLAAAASAAAVQTFLSGLNDAVRNYEYLATSGQTVFTGADINANSLLYRVGRAQVFRNGVRMNRTIDYTETNETTLTFAYPLTSGDRVNIDPLTFGGAAGEQGPPGNAPLYQSFALATIALPSIAEGETFFVGTRAYRKQTGAIVVPGLNNAVPSDYDIPQYLTIAEAEADVIAPNVNEVVVAGRSYFRVASNPLTRSAFQDANDAWFSAVQVRSNGPVEVWVMWGQSEMRGVTGSPAAIGGDRSARSNVLSYVRGTTVSGAPDGWYAVGPEDDAWPFHSSIAPVGSPFYLAAAARAEEIGGTVCIVMDAIGGAASGLFVQGGSRWAGLQASWSAAQIAPLPGRGGQTLAGLGKTRADVVGIWQGSSDRDALLGTGNAAATADDWVLRWRTILNSLEAPSGVSVPIAAPNRTKFVFFEMLHGATSGGAPGVGDPTDSRNRDLHKLFIYTSGKRAQIRIVPMGGVNTFTSNPEFIGSFDNLHLNGAAYNEVSRRLSAVLGSFDPTAPHPEYVTGANGACVCYPDGTFEAWSNDLVTSNNVAVTFGSSFRTSALSWTFPFPVGFAAAGVPTVSAGQCSTAVANTYPQARVYTATLTNAVALATSEVTIAGVATFKLRATGFWVRT